jgi:hypothetical protein
MLGWIIDEFKKIVLLERNMKIIRSMEWNCKYCNLEFVLPNIDIVTNERHCPNCYSIKI